MGVNGLFSHRYPVGSNVCLLPWQQAATTTTTTTTTKAKHICGFCADIVAHVVVAVTYANPPGEGRGKREIWRELERVLAQ